jgi:uncharacterized protein YcfJ
MRKIRGLLAVSLLATLPALAACSENTGRGAAIGAAAGAGLGAVTGNGIFGSAAKGAAAGAAGGFIYDQVK